MVIHGALGSQAPLTTQMRTPPRNNRTDAAKEITITYYGELEFEEKRRPHSDILTSPRPGGVPRPNVQVESNEFTKDKP